MIAAGGSKSTQPPRRRRVVRSDAVARPQGPVLDIHAGPRSLARLARPALALAVLVAAAGCEGTQSVLAPASRDARLIAGLSWWMFGVGTFVLLVTLGLLLVGVSLQRRGGPRDLSFRQSTVIVVGGGVVAPILAIIALSVSGVAIGDETEGPGGATGPNIEVVGKRWWWEFRYLDDAGETIAVTANELHLPAGERAALRLISDNVIHSFWAPNLQGKTDLIPGAVNTLYAEPEVAGEWRGQCAEYCGLQHALMGFLVIARPRPEFDAWLAAQAEDASPEGRGWQVFLEQGCDECHTIRGTTADGDEGPDLTHLASRRTIASATLPNTRGNLGGWITSTQHIKPGALMPAFAPEPEDLFALLDFLEGLE